MVGAAGFGFENYWRRLRREVNSGDEREDAGLEEVGLVRWWALQDSNLRLPPCEGGTLPLS
jgi:hypothetical protein